MWVVRVVGVMVKVRVAWHDSRVVIRVAVHDSRVVIRATIRPNPASAYD